MEIDNNTNISNLIASSISKLNLNTASTSTVSNQKQNENQEQNLIQENEKDDVKLVDDDKIAKNPIDVDDVKKYANLLGEDLTVEEIRYGLMYGRSVIAEWLC